MTAVMVAPGTLRAGGTVVLDEDERHHLRVRRALASDAITLMDGEGVTAAGELVGDHVATARVFDVVMHPAPPATILAVGAGDRDRFVALAEKCTELGVSILIPLDSERSRNVETRMRTSSVAKARARARVACKQSRNPWATRVDDVTALSELPGRFTDVRWMLADPEGPDLIAVRSAPPVGWLIGPEGGFTDTEITDLMLRLSASRVAFSDHVLRFDTAAIAAASLSSIARRRATEE